VDQRGSALELGVVNAVRPQLSSESCIGPGEVWGGGGLLVLVGDGVDKLYVSFDPDLLGKAYLVSLGLGIRLEVAVHDKVVSDLGVVPSAEDGRLGSGVVFVEEFLVLFLLELGSVVGADYQ